MAIVLNGTTGITAPDISVTAQSTDITTTGDITAVDATLSGGVYLGGTGAANYLDDYEEGDFSPTVAGSSVVGTPTYTVQDGSYVKIGNLVTVQFEVAISGWSSAPSGNLEIGNLPFAAPSGNQFQAVGGVMTNNLNFSSPGVMVNMYKGSGSNYLLLYSSNDDGGWASQSAFNEGFNIISSLTYRTT